MSRLRTNNVLTLVSATILAACGAGGPISPADGALGGNADGISADAMVGSDTMNGHDASEVDTLATADASVPICVPLPGTTHTMLNCAEMELGVFFRTDTSDTFSLVTRLWGGLVASPPTCVLVDSVEFRTDGPDSPLIQEVNYLSQGGRAIDFKQGGEIARAAPAKEIVETCLSDQGADRFEPYGVIVKGRMDGGTFEARCSRAESGSRWPPALVQTCHQNLDSLPLYSFAQVVEIEFQGVKYTSTNLSVSVPHQPGGEWLSVDDTVKVMPYAGSFFSSTTLDPFLTEGWTGVASDNPWAPSLGSQISLTADGAKFDATLCPLPSTEAPGPGAVAPPLIMARISGTTGRGPGYTEFLIECYQLPAQN